MKAIDAKLAQLRKRSYYERLSLKKTKKQIKYICAKCNKEKITYVKDYYEGRICKTCLPLEERVKVEDILADVAKVVEKVGEQLTTEQYRQHGEYNLSIVYRICKKSWKILVKEATAILEHEKRKEKKEKKEEKKEKNIKYICPKCNKVKMTYARYYYEGRVCRTCSPSGSRIEMSDILTDIKRVVRELGYQPTIEQYKEYGKYGLSTIYRVCNMSWKDILSSLGYKVLRRVHDAYSFQEVVAELERVSKELGKLPSYSEYMERGKISATALRNATRETKWHKILAKLFNLDINTIKLNISGNKEAINTQLEKLRQIASKLGRSPSLAEANKYGVNVELIRKRLNKDWAEVLKQAGIEANDPSISSQNYYVKNEDILSDINRVAKELGTYPSVVKYEKLGYFLPDTVQYRFNTNWHGVISLAKSAAEKSNLELSMPMEKN